MSEPITGTDSERFTIGFYFKALTKILGTPGRFFRELPGGVGFRQPFGFLVMSSLFFAGASLTCIHERPVLMGGILIVNALAMPFITACAGFVVMTMTLGKRITFERLFAVYAFAAGATLIASWIPLFVWLTEPWKWMLISIGLVKGCGLKWFQAILIIGCSVFILILFFWSLAPVILHLKKLTG